MRIVHDDGSGSRTLASDVRVADSTVARMRGLMFGRALDAGEGVVFRFGEVRTRRLHSMFVFAPFDAVWVRENTVVQVSRFKPWVGYGSAKADVVVELPSGGADPVEVGDTVSLVGGSTPTG